MPRLLVLLAALAASLLVALAPPAQAAKKKKRACKKGQVTMVVKGRKFKVVKRAPRKARRKRKVVCLKRTRPPTSLRAVRAASKRLLRSRRLRLRHHRKLERKRPMKRLKRHLPRLSRLVERGPPAVRTARARHTTTQSLDGNFKGADGTLETTLEVADPGEVGSGMAGQGELSISTDGDSVARRAGFSLASFADRCPGAGGKVDGSMRFGTSSGASVKTDALRRAMTQNTEVSVEMKLEGQVGDDGRLEEFSYRGTAAAEVRGYDQKGRYWVKVYRVALSGGPVSRTADLTSESELSRILARSQVRGWGPRGDNLDASELKMLRQLALLAEANTLILGRERLLEAEKAWYDRAECVSLAFDPATGQTRKGGRVEGSATARLKSGGASIPGARVTLESCGPGTVTPTAGSSAARFVLSDPARQWSKDVPACVKGETISRRGRGEGRANYTVRGGPLVPLFNVTVRFKSYYYGCENGGEVGLDDATITGSLTRRSGTDEVISIGRGSASGWYRTVLGDCDNLTPTEYVSEKPTEFTAQYTRDSNGSISPENGLAFGQAVEDIPRWGGFDIYESRNGKQTGSYTDPSTATRTEWEVTISNLRPSED